MRDACNAPTAEEVKRNEKEAISWTTLKKRHFVFQNERVFNKRADIYVWNKTPSHQQKEKYGPSCKVILVCGSLFEYEQNLVSANYNNYN